MSSPSRGGHPRDSRISGYPVPLALGCLHLSVRDKRRPPGKRGSLDWSRGSRLTSFYWSPDHVDQTHPPLSPEPSRVQAERHSVTEANPQGKLSLQEGPRWGALRGPPRQGTHTCREAFPDQADFLPRGASSGSRGGRAAGPLPACPPPPGPVGALGPHPPLPVPAHSALAAGVRPHRGQ